MQTQIQKRAILEYSKKHQEESINTILMIATHDDQLTQMLDKKIAIIGGEIKSL